MMGLLCSGDLESGSFMHRRHALLEDAAKCDYTIMAVCNGAGWFGGVPPLLIAITNPTPHAIPQREFE